MVALTEVLRAAIEPGDRVATATPVYGPFYWAIDEAGGDRVDVPLAQREGGEWGLDLDAIEAAFRDGVRAFVLCNPHNPIGIPHSRDDLVRLAELAAEHDVLVISNEIHAALTHSDAIFVPYLSVSDAARERGVVVTSASKAFNLAGLLCAFWIPGSPAAAKRIERMPQSVVHRVSHLGTHAAIAGFTGSRDWLDSAVAAIEARRAQLRELLAERLPEVAYHEPRASYLAWLDFRPLGWGDDPAKRILERGKVALTPGRQFGEGGRGFARINIACSPEVLAEGVARIAAAR
jgi:cystathionine beta-lyase